MPGRKSVALSTFLVVVAAFTVSGCGGSPGAKPEPTLASSSPAAGALPVFGPDDPLALFTNVTGAGGGIFVIRPDGSGVQQLGGDVLPGVHKHPEWSPDGQRVVFIDEATEKMFIAHLDGSATESVAACDEPGCDYPAWSPDGSRIAFSRYENAAGVTGPAAVGIYALNLSTSEVSAVVRLERPLLADVPRWSPDGTQIVFGVDKMDEQANEVGAAIAIVPTTGGKPRFLTEFNTFAYAPDWGTISNEIVFSTEAQAFAQDIDEATETGDIYLIRPDGSGVRQLTTVQPGQRLSGPRWTPDGTKITAYDHRIPGGVIIDPANGGFEPYVTTGNQTRPLVRPPS